MKKFLAILLAATMVLTLFTGCGSDEETVSAAPVSQSGDMKMSNPTGESWTVLVYLCGTDLETDGGYASVNVAEMCSVDLPENVNVIFQTGGTEEWAISDIDPSMIQRWKVGYETLELADEQPLANMGEAQTLGDFLSWGVTEYPADKYMALLWDHGGGSVAGIALDQLYDGDLLNLRELSEGFSMANTQFEVVGFDACLMATMETAAALTPYARYMVASQELEPGTGWDYTAFLNYLSENPAADGAALGTVICDTFYEKCALSGAEALATLSVTDLSKIPALTAAFNTLAAEMKGLTGNPSTMQPLTQAIFRAENYGGNNDSEGYTNMVDLGDLVNCAEGVLSETGDAVINALTDARVYAVAGEGRMNGHGLSVYVPLAADNSELDAYANLAATSGEYLRFLEGVYDWTVPEGVVVNTPVLADGAAAPTEETQAVDDVSVAETVNATDFNVTFSTGLTEDGLILLDVESGAEIISSVAFDLYYQDDESNSLWYLGSDYDVNQNEDGTQYWDNYRNVWVIINGQLCMMVAAGFTEDYILYTVPVQVNGTPTNLRMIYHQETGEYEVIGTWNGIDSETGMSGRDVGQLADNDVVEFVFDAADMETGEDATFVGDSFTVNGPIVAEEATLFDGVYYYCYEITDIFGNVYTSDYAILTSVGGEISVEMAA